MRLLHRPRPEVHIALLVEAAVERKSVLFGPGAHDQVVRLVVAVAQHARVLAIREAGVHWRSDREAGDQPSARDAVDHREFFGDPGWRVVERQGVAHHAQRGIRRAARQRRGDQIGRRHQTVAVGVVLVDTDRVEPAFRGEFELVHKVVVHQMCAPRVEQRGMDVDPHRWMLLAEVVGKLGVRHQVKPHQLHWPPLPRSAKSRQCALRDAACGGSSG